jgi:hypothetical protein
MRHISKIIIAVLILPVKALRPKTPRAWHCFHLLSRNRWLPLLEYPGIIVRNKEKLIVRISLIAKRF